MELSEYLRSKEFKSHKTKDNKLYKYVVYYYLLFKEEFNKIDDLVNRIDGNNMESNFITIISNKLSSNNASKKEIISRLLSTIGNIKYEIKIENNTKYFNGIIEIFKKYGLNINVKDKTIISNNIDKILENKDTLDNGITALANLVLKSNKVIYLEKEYENIKANLYKFMKDHKFSENDMIRTSYLLEQHKLNTTNKIIVSNNYKVTAAKLTEVTKSCNNDINALLKTLLNDNKERKSEEYKELATITVSDTSLSRLVEVLNAQETLKDLQEKEIFASLETKKGLEAELNTGKGKSI